MRFFSFFLFLVAAVWTSIGVGNLATMASRGDLSGRIGAAGLTVNVVLFILPGLALGAVGFALRSLANRHKKAPAPSLRGG